MSDDYDYGEACPVSMAASVLAERWTLQIIQEMFHHSSLVGILMFMLHLQHLIFQSC